MTNRIPNEQIMCGAIELADIEDIARTFEAKGFKLGYRLGYAAGRIHKRFILARTNICIGAAGIVAVQVAFRLFLKWWAYL